MSAPETWSAVVFNLLCIRTQTSSCFYVCEALDNKFSRRSNDAHAKTAISRPKTTGAAIMVDRKPTPMPIPMQAVSNVVSMSRKKLPHSDIFVQHRMFIPLIFQVLFEARNLLKLVGQTWQNVRQLRVPLFCHGWCAGLLHVGYNRSQIEFN